MSVFLDVDFYWVSVGSIAATMAGFWALRRLKSLFSR